MSQLSLLKHHNFSHKPSQKNFDSLITSRAKEISVDRIGLIASQELKSCLSAMIKCISGLDSKHLKINISRLGQGIPIGGEIENLDDGTLISAFKNRKEII